jgi:microcystin-dependent protein
MSRNVVFKKSALRAVAAAAVLGGASLSASACGTEDYIGTICTFAFNFCPDGYLQAAGQELQVSQYQALFSLIGYTYGGNNSTTFKLPDLRGRTTVGSGQGTGLSNLPWGQASGAETQTLTAAQLPAHTHGLNGAQASGTVNASVTVSGLSTATTGAVAAPAANTANTVGKVGAGQPAFYPYNASTAVPLQATASVSTNGAPAGTVTLPVTGATAPNTPAGAAFSVVNPRVAMTVCIVNNGLYPTRP